MSFFNFNIFNAAVDLLPPDKRYAENVNFIQSLLAPLQWARDLFFGSYYEGTNTPYAAGTYNYLDQVSYEGKVYSSLVDNNTDLPTTSNWELLQDDFIGAKERALYTNQKIVFEYALNREFSTLFRQPPAVSDIFIENAHPRFNQFIVGVTEDGSSSVGQNLSSSNIGATSTNETLYNFTVNIPTTTEAIYGELRLQGFIEKYTPSGLKYTIKYY